MGIPTVRFRFSSDPEPHKSRRNQMLKKHPELRALFGRNPWSAVLIFGLLAIQFLLGWLTADMNSPIHIGLALSLGAVLTHALFVLIHECTHNLVLNGSRANRLLAMTANLGITFPLAMGYRKLHLLHHAEKGDPMRDGDIPSQKEANWVGSSPIRKLIWIALFFYFEGVSRVSERRNATYSDPWIRESTVLQLAFQIFLFTHYPAVAHYLLLSTLFGLGAGPFMGKWIGEHFAINGMQETYSYYGPLNRLMFNAGFHHEHHDLPAVPWNRIRKVKQQAPEFYETLASHSSYRRLCWRFIADRELTLWCRVTRGRHSSNYSEASGLTVSPQRTYEPSRSQVAEGA